MLTSLRIQNFRSIRDASVKLGQVNLFIGPNNSGKSNFLKGIEVIAAAVFAYPTEQSEYLKWYEKNLSRGKFDRFEPVPIIIQAVEKLSEDNFCEVNYSLRGSYQVHTPITPNMQAALVGTDDESEQRMELDLKSAKPSFLAFPREFSIIRDRFRNCLLYKIEPVTFDNSVELSYEPMLTANGANLANFLNTLSQNNKAQFKTLETDFETCVGNLVSIATPPDPDKPGHLKLKFFDIKGNAYWADEVSEGVLYFLALLCIVHQPDPPKLLLLEEPEKGIHPRRIREVMDFIFELARMRDIQIILTSHSPYVVDHFRDIPECISVFDRENGETVIRNAKDIMDAKNAELRAVGEEPIHFSDGLGEYWVSGFLGGVPDVLGTEARPA